MIVSRISDYFGGLRYGYFGNYKNWQQAIKATTGYDKDLILEKVKESMLKVKNGQAAYERDSVLFDKVEYFWPLLSSLLWIASKENNKLNIIDFGGSLGSTYFQNLFFLKHLNEIKWSIIEQPNFVETGKKFFSDEKLNFYENLDICLSQQQPDAILLSSVLEYLEKPYPLLEEVLKKNFKYIIIDRTKFLRSSSADDRLTIQKVPSGIYDASYPCWFFNEQKFLNIFKDKYALVSDFPALGGAIDEHGIKGEYKGFIFELK